MSGNEQCAGGIVLGDGGTVAMVRHQNDENVWLFPKGRVDAGESDEAAARREVAEETGIHELELIDDLGIYERLPMPYPGNPNRTQMKDIHMFLFAAPLHAELAPTMEIEEARWIPFRDVATVIGNDKDRAWFATVFDRVREAIQRD
ncbi:NUDIX hydrolase [Patescibacteria group bacterium]|nr:NUDIX hydrolase [Patescibacteria group bacterium]MBU1754741.1 NUDIX hydrolase [Patescibacteria group bacterium]